MSAATSIQWTDRTWNPVRGCSRVSPGCDNCYAMGIAYRFSGPGKPYEGLALKRGPDAKRPGVDWTGRTRLVLSAIDEPLSWRKPARIFVNSMSDLFHDGLDDEEIDQVLATMGACDDAERDHTFQVLTKRAERMRDYLRSPRARAAWNSRRMNRSAWPARNVWWGVSAEDQERADERIPLLLETPAAVRFVSVEPQLGSVDLTKYLHDSTCLEFLSTEPRGLCICSPPREVHVDWVIAGGESGRNARPYDVAWARSLRDQCASAKDVAYFQKQLGADPHDSRRSIVGGWCPGDPEPDTRVPLKDSHGGDPSEWPEPFPREFPRPT